jgi:hypothetical protein
LTAADIGDMQPVEMGVLTANQVAAFDPQVLASGLEIYEGNSGLPPPPNVVASLTSPQIKAFSTPLVQSVLSGFSSAQLGAITPGQIGAMQPGDLAALPPGQVAGDRAVGMRAAEKVAAAMKVQHGALGCGRRVRPLELLGRAHPGVMLLAAEGVGLPPPPQLALAGVARVATDGLEGA